MGLIYSQIGEGDDAVEILVEELTSSEESPENLGGRRRGAYGPTRGATSDAFQKSMELIRHCAEQVADTVGKIRDKARPDEVEVQLGIKIDAKAGAFIARAGTEAQLQVRLKWGGSGHG